MNRAVRWLALASALAVALAAPVAASATSPAYKGYCGKQAKKFKQVVRNVNKDAGLYEYSRRDKTTGTFCLAKYKIWDYFTTGKISFPVKPLYVPDKCLVLPNFTNYWGTQLEIRAFPLKRRKGHWTFPETISQGFGPVGPGDPGSFNPHNVKAVKSPIYKVELLDNCVVVVSFRSGGKSAPGSIYIFEARNRWVPYFDTPYPTLKMSDQELRSYTATPAGDHAVTLSWTVAGVPQTETFVDEGVATKY